MKNPEVRIDHIFIMASENGKEAEALCESGLKRGSGRKHEGVGTENARFFFSNFYLEILWVHNQSEAKSNAKLGIWERYNYKKTRYSPFGLCLENTQETNDIFENALKWQPDFLPQGNTVDIITNERMPWIFRFPLRGKKNQHEPKSHPLGINKLTKAVFNLKALDFVDTLREIEKKSNIEFKSAEHDSLVLEFDNFSQGKSNAFKNLNLTMRF